MRTGSSLLSAPRQIVPSLLYLSSQNDGEGRQTKPLDDSRRPAAHEDLPYKVELWDADKNSVEQVLAVTANGSIGYAAYYAAVREYPDRYVSLRHKGSIIARSNGPGQ